MAPRKGTKPVGRPRQQPDPGERVQLSFRVTPELKRRLDNAADQGGRSQSQEAELRIAQSFQQQDLFLQVLTLACGSREVAAVAAIIVLSIAGLGYRYGYLPRWLPKGDKHWLSDPRAFDQVAVNIITLLNAFHPGGPRIPLTGLATHGLGAETARAMIRAIRGDGNTDPLPVDAIREMLGPLVAQLERADAKPVDIREWGPAYPVGITTARIVADAILRLIGSTPQTPSRDEIAGVIHECMKLPEQKEPASE